MYHGYTPTKAREVSIAGDNGENWSWNGNPIGDDSAVPPENILGVYVRKSDFYRWLNSFADTRKLLLLFVMIPLTIISILELRSLIRIGKEVHEESEEEAAKREKEEYERRMREAIQKEKKRLAEENYQPDDDEVNKP